MARLKKRADGRYVCQIYLGRDEAGKKQYKSIYAKSPAELKEKEAAVRLQLGRGLDLLSQRDGFGQWADDFLRLKEREKITPRQMDNYRRAVRLWKDELHSYEIGQVRADDIERVLLSLADKGLSQRTINLYRSTITQVMRRAVGRVIPTNPADQVGLSGSAQKDHSKIQYHTDLSGERYRFPVIGTVYRRPFEGDPGEGAVCDRERGRSFRIFCEQAGDRGISEV